MKKTNIIKHKVYIDIGSHDKIFMFYIGEIAQKYPTLLHVYNEKISEDLVEATLVYKKRATKR